MFARVCVHSDVQRYLKIFINKLNQKNKKFHPHHWVSNIVSIGPTAFRFLWPIFLPELILLAQYIGPATRDYVTSSCSHRRWCDRLWIMHKRPKSLRWRFSDTRRKARADFISRLRREHVSYLRRFAGFAAKYETFIPPIMRRQREITARTDKRTDGQQDVICIAMQNDACEVMSVPTHHVFRWVTVRISTFCKVSR